MESNVCEIMDRESMRAFVDEQFRIAKWNCDQPGCDASKLNYLYGYFRLAGDLGIVCSERADDMVHELICIFERMVIRMGSKVVLNKNIQWMYTAIKENGYLFFVKNSIVDRDFCLLESTLEQEFPFYKRYEISQYCVILVREMGRDMCKQFVQRYMDDMSMELENIKDLYQFVSEYTEESASEECNGNSPVENRDYI